jgi:hypothetical protein
VGGSKSGQPVFGPRHLVDVVVVTGRVFSEVGLEKTRVKKNQPSVFFWVFWVFLGFSYIFAQKRDFLGFFFSFMNTFRCIQTLNDSHSY